MVSTTSMALNMQYLHSTSMLDSIIKPIGVKWIYLFIPFQKNKDLILEVVTVKL